MLGGGILKKSPAERFNDAMEAADLIGKQRNRIEDLTRKPFDKRKEQALEDAEVAVTQKKRIDFLSRRDFTERVNETAEEVVIAAGKQVLFETLVKLGRTAIDTGIPALWKLSTNTIPAYFKKCALSRDEKEAKEEYQKLQYQFASVLNDAYREKKNAETELTLTQGLINKLKKAQDVCADSPFAETAQCTALNQDYLAAVKDYQKRLEVYRQASARYKNIQSYVQHAQAAFLEAQKEERLEKEAAKRQAQLEAKNWEYGRWYNPLNFFIALRLVSGYKKTTPPPALLPASRQPVPAVAESTEVVEPQPTEEDNQKENSPKNGQQ